MVQYIAKQTPTQIAVINLGGCFVLGAKMKSMERDTAQEILSGYPSLMKIEEVAEALRCVDKTVRNLIAENQLECTRVGRNIFVAKSSVLDYLCRPVSAAQYRPRKK